MKNRVIYWALIVFCAAVFLFSGIYLLRYYMESWEQADIYDDLANMVSQAQTEPNENPSKPTDPDSTDPTDPDASVPNATPPVETQPTEPEDDIDTTGILKQYQAIYKLNQDLVGWITIPGTSINYPVMQSKYEDDFYLDHNFYKDEAKQGAIYVREECDVFAPSDNITIYGHHMKDGSMFYDLDNYMKKSFWKEHQTFTFDTIYEHHTYQVIAVFRTSGTAGEGYPFHIFVDADNEEDFSEFVSDIKDLAMYDTGISAEYGDKLLCLCTCEYSQQDYRLIVVAKQIT